MACYGTCNWRRKSSAVALAAAQLDAILTLPASGAWDAVVSEALAICSKPLKLDKVEADIARRDRAMADAGRHNRIRKSARLLAALVAGKQ
jgi:hypothetical protein